MQKLDKQVELEGRVIQYKVNVHLKKKSSTTKTSKKVGNKFPKEFGYEELGKIKSEISSIIKSCK